MSIIKGYWIYGGKILGWILAWALLLITVGVFLVLDGLWSGNSAAVQVGLQLIAVALVVVFAVAVVTWIVFGADHAFNLLENWFRTKNLTAAKTIFWQEVHQATAAIRRGIESVKDTISGWAAWLKKKLAS